MADLVVCPCVYITAVLAVMQEVFENIFISF
nr:MAG TPA: ferredoxin thioredoxin reductase [Caudoviricetes sp.]